MMTMKKVLLLSLLLLIVPFALFAQHDEGAVINGDFADPSIIKVNNAYYAVGTSSEWAPHFPIYQSTDLKNWHQAGYVFDKAPGWTTGSFWAPEYYKIKDTYYVYYTARRKSDNSSFIGVATSKYPDRGFTDHGVIVAFSKETIDAFVFKDGNQLYITFKAYGLDKRPIELMGSRLSADGLKLEGEPFSLLRDDAHIGMEGQSILKKDGYYYLFYSAGDCCGVKCNYNVRVARSKNFKGPYELYAGNPILTENEHWKCMGHGTFVINNKGNYYYLHHAYNKESTVITGRQALISELVWTGNDGWPSFKAQQIAGGKPATITDSFTAPAISKFWQWDFRHAVPNVKQQKGVLYLSGNVKADNPSGIAITARPVTGRFDMQATVLNTNAALKGLTFYGDANAAIGIGVQNNQVIAWQVKGNHFNVLGRADIAKAPIQLRLELSADRTCKFYYKQDKASWTAVSTPEPVKADDLPQWDRSPRMGLHFKGDAALDAQFSDFSIKPVD